MVAITDRKGIKTAFRYDAAGRMIELRGNKDELLTTTKYDSQGRIIAQTDARGNTGYIEYEQILDGLTFVTCTDKNGKKSGYLYSKTGRLLTRTNELGHTWTYEFDSKGQMVKATSPAGKISTQEFNKEGDIVGASSPSIPSIPNELLQTIGAPIAEMLAILGGDTREGTTEFDDRERPVKTTFPDGTTILREFDGNHNLVQGTGRDGRKISMTYDGENRLLSIVSDSGTVTINRNDAGEVTGVSLPDGGACSLTYDADGNLLDSKWTKATNTAERIEAKIKRNIEAQATQKQKDDEHVAKRSSARVVDKNPVDAPEGFQWKTMEPTGGKILCPDGWYFDELHAERPGIGMTYLWNVSKDAPNSDAYTANMAIQMHVNVQKRLGVSPKDFLMDFLIATKQSADEVYRESPIEKVGLYDRTFIEFREGDDRLLYSAMWNTERDIAFVVMLQTKADKWQEYQETFNKMGNFELVDWGKLGM